MNSRSFSYNFNTKKNIGVQTANELYQSKISPLDSLIIDTVVVHGLLKITDPIVEKNGSEEDILHAYFSRNYGLMMYVLKNGILWQRK